MAFSPAPEYQVFPTRERPLKPYEAAVRAAQDDARSSCARSRPTSRCRTSSRARRRWPPSSRACRSRRSSRTSTRTSRPGCRRSRSARGGRARGWARVCGRQTDRAVAVGLEQGRSEYNDCRARLGLAAAAVRAHRALALADDGRRRCRSSSTRARGRRGCRVVGPLLWEPGGPLVAPWPGDGAGRAGRPLDLAGPLGLAAAGRASTGSADEPVRVIAIGAPSASPRRANAVARALDVLRAHDAALRPRDHPRRPRHAGAGAGVRLPGRGLPGRRRHGRERRAGRLGGRGRPARAALLHAVGRAARGAAGAGGGRRCASGRRRSPRGRSRTRAPRPPRPSWSAGPRRARGRAAADAAARVIDRGFARRRTDARRRRARAPRTRRRRALAERRRLRRAMPTTRIEPTTKSRPRRAALL